MEKQLHSLLWKIDFAEISVEDRRRSQISIESMVSINICPAYFMPEYFMYNRYEIFSHWGS